MKEVEAIKNKLFKSAATLCIFGLVSKGMGMLFRVYLSARIGSEGMGLYQLVMSVYSLFTTFATAGLTVSVSRLTGEAMSKSNPDTSVIEASKAKNTGVLFGLILGFASLAVMFFTSGFTAKYLLSESKSLIPMRILSLSMPFMAVAACYKGYYIASNRVSLTATAQVFEQAVKIAVTYIFFTVFLSKTTDIGLLTVGITSGLCVGEIFCCIYLWIFDLFSKKRRVSYNEKKLYPLKRITNVVIPIGVSAYITGILHTVESILVPFCFTLYGGDRGFGLSQFGLIRGMVIPTLFFPFSFLSATVSVLIPEISRLKDNRWQRNEKIKKSLAFAFVFGICAGGLFFFLPSEISSIFYSENGEYPTKILALVTPFMYVETVCDSLLKAVGKQVYTLKVSVINSVARIALLLLLVPSLGADGYLWLLVGSNMFSFFSCYLGVRKETDGGIGALKSFVLPLVCSCAGGLGARYVLEFTSFSGVMRGIAGGSVYIILFCALYFGLVSYGNKKHI